MVLYQEDNSPRAVLTKDPIVKPELIGVPFPWHLNILAAQGHRQGGAAWLKVGRFPLRVRSPGCWACPPAVTWSLATSSTPAALRCQVCVWGGAQVWGSGCWLGRPAPSRLAQAWARAGVGRRTREQGVEDSVSCIPDARGIHLDAELRTSVFLIYKVRR